MSARTSGAQPAGQPARTAHVEVHRGGDRLKTRLSWLDSKHSFSFGAHYEPDNTHHGLLLVNNDDIVTAGAGFDTHPHRDMEIVTWVLEGSLVHQDSLGHSGVIYPGLAQRMSAGQGILHSEKNDAWRLTQDAADEPVHFVQMWVVPDEPGLHPGYQQHEVGDELASGKLVPIASGLPQYNKDAAISINSRYTALHIAQLAPGQSITLPEAPYLHVFLTRGEADMEETGRVYAGDAIRLTRTGGQRITGLEPAGAEVLVWEMHARLGQ